MTRKIIWLLVLIFVFVAGCQGSAQTGYSSSEGDVKEYDATISGYSYKPSSIEVNYGDVVRINIKNNDGVTHGISLPVFGVREFVRPGETKTIQFVADQYGSPETFCSTDHGEKLLINVI